MSERRVPWVLAHRGVSSEFPENTLEAFGAAASRGADGVELDVRRTADGQLAVHHDPRLADGRPIVDLTSADLPADVPLLRSALEACAGLQVNIEIKNLPGEPDFDPECALVDRVAALVRAMELIDRVIVSSFNFVDITRIKKFDGDLSTGWLVLEIPDRDAMIGYVVDGGHTALHPPATRTTADLVVAAHDRGVSVNAWTVDDPGLIVELADHGVDALITNDPATARLTLTRWATSAE